MTLRLVVLAHPRHPVAEPFAGGMESHTWHLCRALTALGVETTLFAPAGSDPSIASDLRSYAPLTLSASSRADKSRPTDLELHQHHAMVQAVAAITGEGLGDVVHNQTMHYLPIITAGLLPPMVTTLHTVPFSWTESAMCSGGLASDYVAVSRFLSGQFAPLLPVPPTVIHNGVDTDVFHEGPGGDGLVWCGRLVPEKAPHLAIDAAVAAGRHLRLMGPISDPGYFDRDIRGRLGPHAEYVGHLDRGAVAREFQHAAACLVTSVWPEPFGLTAAESLACGTPVVGFRVGGLAEVVADPELGRAVPVGDVAAMAAGVSEVVGLDRRRTARIAHRRYGLRRMALRYLELFHGLASIDRVGHVG